MVFKTSKSVFRHRGFVHHKNDNPNGCAFRTQVFGSDPEPQFCLNCGHGGLVKWWDSKVSSTTEVSPWVEAAVVPAEEQVELQIEPGIPPSLE
jgi:hypothetical protein